MEAKQIFGCDAIWNKLMDLTEQDKILWRFEPPARWAAVVGRFDIYFDVELCVLAVLENGGTEREWIMPVGKAWVYSLQSAIARQAGRNADIWNEIFDEAESGRG